MICWRRPAAWIEANVRDQQHALLLTNKQTKRHVRWSRTAPVLSRSPAYYGCESRLLAALVERGH
jgi:hypothetical protein